MTYSCYYYPCCKYVDLMVCKYGCILAPQIEDKEEMKSWYEMLKEFHAACGTIYPKTPTIPTYETRNLRRNLIEEEYKELMGSKDGLGALYERDLEAIAKESCDLIYVLIGLGLTYGINMDKAFAEVHRSNMTKFPKDGKVVRRADGKIMKPETYEPANMKVIYDVQDSTDYEFVNSPAWSG